MGMTRRYVLSILFKLFDVDALGGVLPGRLHASLRAVSAISLPKFLAMRISDSQFCAFHDSGDALACAVFLFQSVRIQAAVGRIYRGRGRLESDFACDRCALRRGQHVHPEYYRSPVTYPILVIKHGLGPAEPASAAVHARANPNARTQQPPNIDRGNQSPRVDVCQAIGSSIRYWAIGSLDLSTRSGRERKSSPNRGMRLPAISKSFPSFVRANVVDEVVITLPLKSFYRRGVQDRGRLRGARHPYSFPFQPI